MADYVTVKFKCANCGTTQEKAVTWGRYSAIVLPKEKGDRIRAVVKCQKCGHRQLAIT